MPAPARVASLSAQGMPEGEIIRAMRGEGYSPIEIDRSLKMAIKGQASSPQRTPPEQRDYSPYQSPTQLRPQPAQRFPEDDDIGLPLPGEPFKSRRPQLLDESLERDEQLPELPELPKMNFRPPSEFEGERTQKTDHVRKKETIDKSELEEIAEGIIQEKWQKFEKDMKELDEKIASSSARMDSIENLIRQMKSTEKSEIEQIKASIMAYSTGMEEMSSKLESIDRSMKDSLTPMLQTLRSMSDTIRTIKKKP